MPRTNIDWLLLTRVMTQYVVPGLLAVAFLVEISGSRTVPAYDRLFFSLERKIDTQAVSDAGAEGSLLGRVRDMVGSKVQHLRGEAVLD